MEQGDLDKALDTLAAGCIAFPGDVALNSTAASSFLVASRFAEALHYIEQCERLLPDNPAAFKEEAAAALRGLGRHEEAAAKLRETRP